MIATEFTEGTELIGVRDAPVLPCSVNSVFSVAKG